MKLSLLLRSIEPALVFFATAIVQSAQAGSATWSSIPTSGDWNIAANWTPGTVPNSSSDIATFVSSSLTDLFVSENTEVNSVVFAGGAASFTISPIIGTSFTISGEGVVNDSGTAQSFVMSADANFNHAYLNFIGAATAGSNLTTYINKAAPGDSFGGVTSFVDTANAGSATFVTEGGIFPNARVIGGSVVFTGTSASAGTATFITGGGTVPKANGGEVAFLTNATAANATIINNPAEAPKAQGGFVEFSYTSTAGYAVITNNGASIDRALGGATTFTAPARADHSTLIANGGSNGGGGGLIIFGNGSFGDFARIEVFGNGTLHLENLGDPGVTIGSLEGNGLVSMGAAPLNVGSNNASTVFGGTISDSSFARGGTLIKMGSGTLSLVGANTYTGPTIVRGGTLAVRNQHGSATGTGLVTVKAGNLVGRGVIAGTVVVGSDSARSNAVLSPGSNLGVPQTLTIQSDLTSKDGSTYNCVLNSDSVQADKVVAAGVVIVANAQISLDDSGSAVLPLGTALVVLDNTSATPFTGTFSNLPDGAILSVDGNNFQASYEGGDGNDLSLTVVP